MLCVPQKTCAYITLNRYNQRILISGVKTDFIIDTINAGVGTLAVTIDGPSKVSMDCTEVEEGYKVRYTPLAPGDYYISIKYNNNHIVGSPFKVHSTGKRTTVYFHFEKLHHVSLATLEAVNPSIEYCVKLTYKWIVYPKLRQICRQTHFEVWIVKNMRLILV